MVNKKYMYCCDEMEFLLNENKVSISYYPVSRCYFIDPGLQEFAKNISPFFTKDNFEYARQPIYFCPWCGKKLAGALNKTYFETLEKEYKIWDLCDSEQEKRMPQEFKTDEWWMKRGF